MSLARHCCFGLAVAWLSALPCGAPRAQSGRPMTIDDLLAAVRVADPQLSPDGRTVVYTRTTTDLQVGPAERGHLERAADGGAAEGADRRRQVGEHTAVVARRPAPRVHLDPRRRAAGVRRRRRRRRMRRRSRISRWACSRRSSSLPTARGSRSSPTSTRSARTRPATSDRRRRPRRTRSRCAG